VKIGLLQCDHVMQENRPEFGDYSDFFGNLFHRYAPEIVLKLFDIQQDEYPEDPNGYAGFIGTGSSRSVWENIDWIYRFKHYVHDLYANKKKFIGICFGHQMIAEALGGKCQKSERGWGIGVKKVAVIQKKGWMNPMMDSYRLIVSHQDQISILPENSEVLGGNEHCPYSMITVGGHFLGIQAHPEFTPDYSRRLMQLRIDRIGSQAVQEAEKTLREKTDEAVVTQWMANFFRQ
jgi:GMP synthase-like glutamine amidotransferase